MEEGLRKGKGKRMEEENKKARSPTTVAMEREKAKRQVLAGKDMDLLCGNG